MRVLVTGAGGQLGRDLVAVLRGQEPAGGTGRDWWGAPGPAPGVEVVGATHEQLPVHRRAAVLQAVEHLRPDIVIHAAAFTAVDACESEPEWALAVNALGTRFVAEACRLFGAHLLYVSTDYVFDGSLERPYHEWDAPRPLSVYGLSKRGGELECPLEATVVRTSWVYAVEGANMLRTVLELAAREGPLRFVEDQRGSPTFTADLAKAVAALALDRRPGTYHVTNQGATSWRGFAQAVVAATGGDPSRVRPITTDELRPPRPAPRPANSVLDNLALRLGELPLLPAWDEALERAVATIDGLGLR